MQQSHAAVVAIAKARPLPFIIVMFRCVRKQSKNKLLLLYQSLALFIGFIRFQLGRGRPVASAGATGASAPAQEVTARGPDLSSITMFCTVL